jgi:hypothetical protein
MTAMLVTEEGVLGVGGTKNIVSCILFLCASPKRTVNMLLGATLTRSLDYNVGQYSSRPCAKLQQR